MQMDRTGAFTPSQVTVLPQEPVAEREVLHLRLQSRAQTENEGEKELFQSANFSLEELQEAEINATEEKLEAEYSKLIRMAEIVAPIAERLAENPVDTTLSVASLATAIFALSAGTALPLAGALVAGSAALYKLKEILSKPRATPVLERIESAIASAEILKQIQDQALFGMSEVDQQLQHLEEQAKKVEEQQRELEELISSGKVELNEETGALLEKNKATLLKFRKVQKQMAYSNKILGEGMLQIQRLIENQDRLAKFFNEELNPKQSPEEIAAALKKFRASILEGQEESRAALRSIREGRKLLSQAQSDSNEVFNEILDLSKAMGEVFGRAIAKWEMAEKFAAEQALTQEVMRQGIQNARAHNEENIVRLRNAQAVNQEIIRDLQEAKNNAGMQFGLKTMVFGLAAAAAATPFTGPWGGFAAGLGVAGLVHNREEVGQVARQGVNLVRGTQQPVNQEADIHARGFSLTWGNNTGYFNSYYHKREKSRTVGTLDFRVGNVSFSCPFDLNKEEAITKVDQKALLDRLTKELEEKPSVANEILNLIEDLNNITIDRRYPDEITRGLIIPRHQNKTGLIGTGVLFKNLQLDAEKKAGQ